MTDNSLDSPPDDGPPASSEDLRDADARAALDRLIRNAGEGYAAISRLIGRNAAYVQQYIKRGVPRRLDEDDRRTLARHFAVSEELLGGPPQPPLRVSPEPASANSCVAVPQLRHTPGQPARLLVDRMLLADSTAGREHWLAAHRVDDDSMRPTLIEGDMVLIDTADRQDRLRDGIYALENGDRIFIKRLALNPVTRRIRILSDSVAYPPINECAAAEIHIVGRVVWYGRSL